MPLSCARDGCWLWGPPHGQAPGFSGLFWVSLMGARLSLSWGLTPGHHRPPCCWLPGGGIGWLPLLCPRGSAVAGGPCPAAKGTTSSHLWERMFGFQWSVAMDLGYVKGAENYALGPWEAQWGQGVGKEEHPRGCGLREGQLRQVSHVGRLQPWSAGGQREAGCHAQATARYN